jgi:hypothetical protein
MSAQESLAPEDIARLPVRELLQRDELHRRANTLQQFLQDCNIRERTWNSAIQILQTWVGIQEAVSEYILYGDEPSLNHTLADLRKLLANIGKLVLFNSTPTRLSVIDLNCETQLSFDKLLYRYQGFDRPILCLVPLSTQPSPNEFQSVVSRINELGRRAGIVLVLVLGNADNVRYVHRRYSDYNIILVDEHDLKTLLFADDARIAFNGIVVRDVDLRRIQPYSHVDIRPSMFYGRELEIGMILDNPTRSYAIFGPRRIGKTFLLQEIERRLSAEPDNEVVYFSCQGQGALTLRYRLLQATGVATTKEETKFEMLLRSHIERSGKAFVFILDEVDDLVVEERKTGGKLFTSLRNLHNELQDKCRFIFAGFQALAAQFDYYYSPFYNFPERLPLDCLSEEAAMRLVSQPMENDLLLRFSEREKLIEEILEKTMRHPALIQFMCAKLIERVCEDRRTTISRKDVNAIFEDYEYRGLINKSFWKILSKLQQLIALQMLRMPGRVTNLEIQQALATNNVDLGIGELEDCLEGMVVAGIIRKTGQQYFFVHGLLSELLSRSEDTMPLFDQLRRELNAVLTED